MRYVAVRTATTYGVWRLLDFRCKRCAIAVDMLALRASSYAVLYTAHFAYRAVAPFWPMTLQLIYAQR